MATQKPISTISYNSESFLKEHLDAWMAAHIIQAYQYIKHKGEDGDKDHIHLRLEPNKKIDVMDLQDKLREFVAGQDKPLGVRPFRPSKEEDWFLYAVHDEEYLKLKYSGGEKGEKIPYSWKEIVVPEYYDLEIAWIRARSALKHSTANIATELKRGSNSLDIILQGENPYVVNAIARALYSNDYERLNSDYIHLKAQFDGLLKAIDDYGLIACLGDDKESFVLSRKPLDEPKQISIDDAFCELNKK